MIDSLRHRAAQQEAAPALGKSLSRAEASQMQQSLHGRSLLIVEDEPLLLIDIESELSGSGANLTVTTMLHHAMVLVEHDGISAAILDHVIGQEDSARLYDRLFQRGIPFVIYTACALPEKDRKGGVLISKPALPGVLRTAVEGLLSPQGTVLSASR